MIGHEGLHRETLLSLLADSGGRDGRSYLATGNVTFTAAPRDLAAVVRRLERGIQAVIGRHEPVITRRHDWLSELVARAPFASFDPAEWGVEVAFLPLEEHRMAGGAADEESGVGDDSGEVAWHSAMADPAPAVAVEMTPTELLMARPRAVPNTPQANPLLERAAGTKATTRAWSTLVRLAADPLR
jgi:hypothetical protein